jgi:hypothetical protein
MINTKYQLTMVPFNAVHFSDPLWVTLVNTNNTRWLTLAPLSTQYQFLFFDTSSSLGLSRV